MPPIKLELSDNAVVVILTSLLIIGGFGIASFLVWNDYTYSKQQNDLIAESIATGQNPVEVGCAYGTISVPVCKDIAKDKLIRELINKK